MTQYDQILDGPEDVPARNPRARRLILLTLIALCGSLMIAILLSDPRVSSAVSGAARAVTGQVGQILPVSPENAPTTAGIDTPRPVETYADPVSGRSADAAPEESSRPVVSRMPKNRIPVRRLGAGN